VQPPAAVVDRPPTAGKLGAVEALLASLIAVAGTLLGSTTTYLFQRHSAGRAEGFAREERLRQERMATYSEFAGALTAHRRAVVNLWFRRQEDPEGPEYRAARAECDQLGAALDHARFRVQLIAGHPGLMALANAAHQPVSAVNRAVDKAELMECENRSRDAVGAFVAAAAAQVLGRSRA